MQTDKRVVGLGKLELVVKYVAWFGVRCSPVQLQRNGHSFREFGFIRTFKNLVHLVTSQQFDNSTPPHPQPPTISKMLHVLFLLRHVGFRLIS